jgi:heme-degrading monooxygenase HmoA
MAFVSITRLRVRSWRYLPAFFIQTFRSARQAKNAAGSLAVSVLRDKDRAFWTCTLWSEEAAMRSFMLSGVHRRVMRHLMEWCDEASVAHWVQDEIEAPSWPDVHRRMQREGRRSKVNHPSHAQRRFEIPEPRTTTALKFK